MKIICLGDSFTEGYLVEDKSYTRFLGKAGFDIVNLGVNGSFMEDMLNRFKRFKGEDKDDTLIVFGGTNDFLNGVSVEVVYKNLNCILNISKASQKIIVLPPYVEIDEIYPLYGMVNNKIDLFYDFVRESLCKMKDVYLIDARKIVSEPIDGVHMGAKFHEKLSEEILGVIND